MLMTVFAVGRKIDFPEDASARPERQSGDMRELIARSCAERPALGATVGFTHGLYSDVVGCDHVLLNKGWRDLQCGRDVVETLRRVVLRQEFIDVDLDTQKIPNGVFIFLAVQAMQHNLVGDVCLAGYLVERILKPRDERVDSFCFRLLRARWRHDASAQFAHGLLEHFRILRNARRGDSLEADTAGFGSVVVTARAVFLDRGQLRVRRRGLEVRRQILRPAKERRSLGLEF